MTTSSQNTKSSETQRGIQTREEIIQAAHELFIRNGYHGTSMRQIARQAGIALGGIYNHFHSKGEIFKDVVLEFHPYHEIIPLLVEAEHENIEDLFRHATMLIDESLANRPEILNLMFIEMVEFRSQHIPELLDIIFPMIAQVMERFTVTSDNLRPIPLPMLMRTFMGMILGYYLTKQALTEYFAPEFRTNALEQFIDIYLHGILRTEIPT